MNGYAYSIASGSGPGSTPASSERAAEAPAYVLELCATPSHASLATTWPGAGADPSADPLAPLRALAAASPDTITLDPRGHDKPLSLLRYPDRPSVALWVSWRKLADLDAVVAALNASRPLELVLDFVMSPKKGPPLHQGGVIYDAMVTKTPADAAVARVLDGLSAPLHALALVLHMACPPLASTAPIGAYLASTRSAALHRLYLFQTPFQAPVCAPEVAALILAALSGTGRAGRLSLGGDGRAWEDGFTPPKHGSPTGMCRQKIYRLPVLTWRSDHLVRPLPKAAAQVLVPARVLLRGRPRPATAEAEATPAAPAPFRILDLPLDVLAMVLHYTASDPTALSERQVARLLAHARSSTALPALAAAVADAQLPRRYGGALVPFEECIALLVDAANTDSGAESARQNASWWLRHIILPTFEEVMDIWLAAGGFHVE